VVRVEIIGRDEEIAQKRSTFFKLIFGQTSGLVCIAIMSSTNKKNFTEQFFKYPEDLPQMLSHIQNNVQGSNVYFCPQLLRDKKRTKENVEVTPNVWSDLDSCPPENMLVEPTVVIESSPERYQAYWVLEEPMDPDDAEDTSRRIAYHHADQGADRSGWDLTQLLRVPFTFNYKYGSGLEVPQVKIISANRHLYRMKDFSSYPETPEYQITDIPMPAPEDLPASAEDLLQARRMTLNPLIWTFFSDEPATHTWSQALWNLEMLLFETGFKREEVYVIAREARCNKYARDGKPTVLLWKDVCRAEQKAMLHSQLLVPKEKETLSLISEEEKNRVEANGDTFVERYIAWASALGDAAPQYHQAGAFIILAGLLSGSVRLPTSFGTIIPNLWFMILADTTLTRKTTSMDIAMDLLMEIEEDVVMATDGSLEGLLTGLSSRPGQPSIFLRDEFSGLLESMTKKDYMAGMAELLTKLYDGKMQKRMLRKEVIEVRDPRLILFAGGIKNRITGLLTFEQVSSGFIPRFVFITAESDLSRLRPIGPPTTKSTGNRDAILEELRDISHQYNQTQVLHIEKLKAEIKQKIMFDATMTEEAWVRYNKLESTLLQAELKHQQSKIMTPVGDRLAKSILKTAILLAASRQRTPDIVVEEIDILTAIKYGEQWRNHAEEVIGNIGKGEAERKLDLILHAVQRKPQGVARSTLMQHYHLDSRTATIAFETLEQRGLITRQKSGRTEILIPTRVVAGSSNG